MITKNGGSRVRFTSSASVKSPGFDINDIGFLQRADQRTLSNWIQMRYDTPSKYLRSFRHNLNRWAGWNFDRDLRFSGGNVNAHAVFANNWSTGFGINVSDRGFDDRATRGGPGVYTNSARALWTYLSSDNRHAVSAGINTYHASDGRGTTFGDLSPSLSYRPSSFLTVSGGLRFSRTLNC